MLRVPATTMQSAWRGLARKRMPNRSRSLVAAPASIISMAQQARPKVTGQMDPARPQLTSLLSGPRSALAPGM